jgi:hypothetical protein
MVTVVLLTTLFTPLIMRGAFMIKCAQDDEEDRENGAGGNFIANVEMKAEA